MAEEEKKVTEPAAEQKVETAVEEKKEAVVEEAMYTNKQLNDLLRRDAEKEVKKLLGEAGLSTSGDIKADLLKLKTLRDSALTEDEKKKALLEEKDVALKTSQEEAEAAKYEAAAARLGVPDDKIASFVKHARVSEGETPIEKMKNYIAEIGFTEKTARNVGIITGTQGLSEEQALLAAARKQAGLTS